MRSASTKILLTTGGILASVVTNFLPAQADDEAVAAQTLTFNKGSDPTSGTLTFATASKAKVTWRAGSGNGANWSNECVRNEGHLPNGVYRIQQGNWEVHHNGVIHGRAVHLPDKQCTNGTLRTELFIHSEQTVDNTQGNTESTRWDGEGDYKSEGCIKMHPNDLAALYKYHEDAAGPNDVVLNVIS